MKTSQEIQQLKNSFANCREEALKDFYTFLKFQSISTDPAYKKDVLACADWVTSYIKKLGFHVEIWPTTGYPTIFAHYDKAGPSQPTLLIYNHYDVQPVDPLDLWTTPPFEPTVRNGQVYARGAQDNKGQCFYVLLALKTLIEQNGSLPINIKLCIEGEEECGSAGLSKIVETKAKELSADYLAVVDLGIPDIDTPTITLGIRGMMTMEVEVQGSHSDLHSGSHGGMVFNPLHALVELLAGLRDKSGKITIPGFYDDVDAISDKDKKSVSWDFDEAKYEKTFGTKVTGGEINYSPLERNWLRPNLEINGITGGYAGPGFKSVIPAKASAKLSCRLVPHQNPQKIGKLIADHLEKHAPKGVKVTVHVHPGGDVAARSSADTAIATAFTKAYEEIFGKTCQKIYCGASIPVAVKLTKASGAELALVGLGLPDDDIHAPNEHFGLDRIEKGFLSIARTIQLLRQG